MSIKSDFVIENGVLVKYSGKGGDITIPDGVITIGEDAFSGCNGLTSISIPESVISIKEYAVFDCKDLSRVYISKGLTSIDEGAFSSCGSLTSFAVDSDNPAFSSIRYPRQLPCGGL